MRHQYSIRRIREGLFSIHNVAGELLCYADEYQEALEIVRALRKRA